MDSKMNVIEFSCEFCSNRFHEYDGGKCVDCYKLLCDKCTYRVRDKKYCMFCRDKIMPKSRFGRFLYAILWSLPF